MVGPKPYPVLGTMWPFLKKVSFLHSTNRLVFLHFQIYLMTIFDISITSGEGYSFKMFSLVNRASITI